MLPVLRHLINEEENRERLREQQIERRLFRDASNPFDLADEQFRRLFRLSKDLAQMLIDEINPFMFDCIILLLFMTLFSGHNLPLYRTTSLRSAINFDLSKKVLYYGLVT
ncbi:hypothetical protein NQ315_012948 [Exocentrus adspersus]|uniref:Uncharacterized protein n=1 Tax=Exocentrus adspersus TaxID=1586481 RepID=A0AAV8VT26_9CUCU|nr:hypothetical protein NQ315_012948 [Exocentrus adspersus]